VSWCGARDVVKAFLVKMLGFLIQSKQLTTRCWSRWSLPPLQSSFCLFTVFLLPRPAANWDSYETVDWWDAVDFIGIDSYFALVSGMDRTHTEMELRTGWQWVMREMDKWHKKFWRRKAIVFLESGCRSIRGAASRPWDSEIWGPTDMAEQANYYAAMFRVVGRYPFIQGYFLWHWVSYLKHGGPNDKSYAVWNKPALGIVRDTFSGKPKPMKQ